MNKSNFNIDSKFERSSLEYLKENEVFGKLGLSNTFFTDDKETQKTGSDLVADLYDEIRQVIDVKAVASMIPTFSQEIINCNSGKVGWIMDNSLKTDYYMYVWHNTGDYSYSHAKEQIAKDYSCIKETDIVLVKKQDIQKFIEENIGIQCNEENAMKIFEVSNKIQRTDSTLYISLVEGKIMASLNKPSTRVYITRSDNVKEQPLNFILRKTDIESLGKTLTIRGE